MKSCRANIARPFAKHSRRHGATVLIAFAALLTAACQTTSAPANGAPALAPGASVKLNQSLTIAPEQVGAYLQNGRIVSANEVQVYQPHCKLELRTRAAESQQVQPDQFVVTRVSRAVYYHSVQAPSPRAVARKVSDGPSFEVYTTQIDLGSERQPAVSRLLCAHWEVPPPYGRHITVGEIQRALGDLMTLQAKQ